MVLVVMKMMAAMAAAVYIVVVILMVVVAVVVAKRVVVVDQGGVMESGCQVFLRREIVERAWERAGGVSWKDDVKSGGVMVK